MTLLRTTLRIAGALALLSVALRTAPASSSSHTLIPDTGSTAVRMRAQELLSGVRVLAVSLRPGDEDLAALAYLRFGAAAQVVNVIVTNGESGEHDGRGVQPRQLAADRREATAAALTKAEIETWFLNFPDPGQVADSAGAHAALPPDSLRERLQTAVTAVKPHIVLLFRDWDGGGRSPLWIALKEGVRDAVAPGTPRKSSARGVTQKDRSGWQVSRFWIDEGKGGGAAVQQARVSLLPGRSVAGIAEELESGYSWQRAQREGRVRQLSYTGGLAERGKRPRTLDDGVNARIPQEMKRLHGIVRSYARDVQSGRSARSEILRRTVRVMDSVDTAIGATMDRAGLRMKILVDWKATLESLRNALLGVSVEYTISENILTQRQLTHVRIQTVTGRSEGGMTEVYFPSAERGWIMNEGIRSRLPLEVPGEYRLVSPERVAYDLPAADYAPEQAVAVRPVMLFLLHKGNTREENFTYRLSLPFRYAPRLSAEVLTPIVRVTPGEYLVTRLTNNSRDGLRDTVAVTDSIVRAPGKVVRLNGKGLFQTDTLHLAWRDSLPEGTYVVPVTLGGIEVARFAARQFAVVADTALRVGLLTAHESSPTADALRRLGMMRVRLVRTVDELSQQETELDVIVIDRRYTTLGRDVALLRPLLRKSAERGVHVLVLAQDAQAWNASPLWDAIRLERDPTLAPQVPAMLDTMHAALRVPNSMDGSSFQDWVFASGYNRVTVTGNAPVEVPVRYDAGRPLMVTAPAGAGRMTYVDCAFSPQWMSIHPGAFRMLANLLSMKMPQNVPHK